MARRSHRLTLLALLLVPAVQGCSTTPHWDRTFGSAVRSNIMAQVLDPAASANRNPATGIDGAAARGAQERYQRSFSQPEAAQPAPLIGAGFGK